MVNESGIPFAVHAVRYRNPVHSLQLAGSVVFEMLVPVVDSELYNAASMSSAALRLKGSAPISGYAGAGGCWARR